MLVALNNNKQLIQLSLNDDRQALKQLRKQQKFFCPACQSPVHLKIGTKNIPHFAHVRDAACHGAFSERESAIHLTGKSQLFDWLQRIGNPQLEAHIPMIQQRPDILYDDIAIEFQYSRLSKERFDERNAGYAKAGLKPLWIPYSTLKLGGVQRISLPNDLQKYIQNDILIAYHPDSERFIYYTSLIHVSKATFLTKIVTLPMNLQTFPFRIPLSPTYDEFKRYMILWQAYRTRMIQYYIRYRRGVQDSLLKFAYDHRLTLTDLPPFIGVPTDFQYEHDFALEWQMVYYYAYYPHRYEAFLTHYPVTETKVRAYDAFLKKLHMKKETQNDLLYAQFVAIKREN